MSRVDLFQAGFPLQGVGESEGEGEGRAPVVMSVGGIRVIHKMCYKQGEKQVLLLFTSH